MNQNQNERREMAKDFLLFCWIMAFLFVALVACGAIEGAPGPQPETWGAPM